MENITGKTIGRYRILERIGSGGIAVVYKAYDTRLDRNVAIKLIRSEVLESEMSENMLKRFEQEARVLAKLEHPNIVNIHDFGDYNGVPYLVMTYYPGKNLKSKTGSPMLWREAVELVIPLARGLAFAHERGVIHRDVKPANILLTAHGEAVLTDLGIAKVLDGVGGLSMTATGTVIGTPEYMAPEQWKGEPSFSSDIYSLGAVLYELLSGTRPYQADTPAAVFYKQTKEPLPLLDSYDINVPEKLANVIYKAMALEPEDRFESMADFATALENLQQELPTELSPSALQGQTAATIKMETLEVTPQKKKMPLYLKVIIGVLGIGLLAVIGGVILSPVFQQTETPAAIMADTEVSEAATQTPAELPDETQEDPATYTATKMPAQTQTDRPTATPTIEPTEPEKDPATPLPTIAPTQSLSGDSEYLLSDDFDDDYRNFWVVGTEGNDADDMVEIKQIDGQILFDLTRGSQGRTNKSLQFEGSGWKIEDLAYMEWRFKQGPFNDYSNFVSLGMGWQVRGSGSSVQCEVIVDQLHCFMNEGDNWNPRSIEVGTIPIVADAWYTLRMEIDPDTAEISAYLDDVLIGTITPLDPDVWLNSSHAPVFGVFSEYGIIEPYVGYVDWVKIGAR